MTKEFLGNINGISPEAITAILEENQRDIEAAKQSTGDGKAGSGGGKMFTQEEVNRIVSDRLAKERSKAEPPQEDEREKDLKAREIRLACRDYLDDKGLPRSLLEALDPSDLEGFTATVERLTTAFPNAFGNNGGKVPQFVRGTGGTIFSRGSTDEALAAAFKSPTTM